MLLNIRLRAFVYNCISNLNTKRYFFFTYWEFFSGFEALILLHLTTFFKCTLQLKNIAYSKKLEFIIIYSFINIELITENQNKQNLAVQYKFLWKNKYIFENKFWSKIIELSLIYDPKAFVAHIF